MPGSFRPPWKPTTSGVQSPEDLAVESLKSGATDCVLKGDLSSLAPAVRRPKREVEKRTERRKPESQIVEAQKKMEVISQLFSGVANDFNNIPSKPAFSIIACARKVDKAQFCSPKSAFRDRSIPCT